MIAIMEKTLDEMIAVLETSNRSDAYIGIDPSLSSTGIAVILDAPDGLNVILHTIKTSPKSPLRRLDDIYTAVSEIVAAVQDFHDMKCVVIEDLPNRANSAGNTGQAHGVCRLAIYHGGGVAITYAPDVPLYSLAPATLKKYATGSGRASKSDMIAAANRVASGGSLVKDDNQADAMHMATLARAINLQGVGDCGAKVKLVDYIDSY